MLHQCLSISTELQRLDDSLAERGESQCSLCFSTREMINLLMNSGSAKISKPLRNRLDTTISLVNSTKTLFRLKGKHVSQKKEDS
jgi:hypothetical protein